MALRFENLSSMMDQIIDKVQDQCVSILETLMYLVEDRQEEIDWNHFISENWMSSIPKYSGSPYELASFIDSLRELAATFDERVVIGSSFTILTGKARSAVRFNRDQIKSIDELAKEFFIRFGKGYSCIQEKLIALQQGENESLYDYIQYCKRINVLIETYKKYSPMPRNFNVEDHNKAIDTLADNAKIYFVKGIRDKSLQFCIFMKKPKDLEEAMELALEIAPMYYGFINAGNFPQNLTITPIPVQVNDIISRRSNSDSTDSLHSTISIGSMGSSIDLGSTGSTDSGAPDSTHDEE